MLPGLGGQGIGTFLYELFFEAVPALAFAAFAAPARKFSCAALADLDTFDFGQGDVLVGFSDPDSIFTVYQ